MRKWRPVEKSRKWVPVRPVSERPTPDWVTSQLRAQRIAEATSAYEAAIIRELAARGKADRLYRTEGLSEATLQAAHDHLNAQAQRADLGATLFKLRSAT